MDNIITKPIFLKFSSFLETFMSLRLKSKIIIITYEELVSFGVMSVLKVCIIFYLV